MKNQAFGIEIELTGITRKKAAKALEQYFNTTAIYEGGGYCTYKVKDSQGREWKIMRDSSIEPEKKYINGEIRRPTRSADEYKVEFVSPICKYEDIEIIQQIIRKFRTAGAFANNSCGIHIHIDGSNHNEKTLRNITNIMASKEDLIYKALQVGRGREYRYCKKVSEEFLKDMNKKKPANLRDLKKIWYEPYGGDGSSQHYHSSRYHGLNLHSFFSKGTIEFRLFNGTTHAGKIKAYIQFCLAVSHQAINQKSASAKKTVTDNEKYTFRTWLLRLGLIGDEFKTAREHLLANLEGDIAWRHAA
ncbi:amidoligase family protein [Clostridium pasteurianum]|uniref:amidoligase family protein n=1 Tax=Clostridium pasteurianum TaxID=1501 RepID=UPI0022608A84|nr:amidoligase family protein [Clostridium pasteurianum]UZW12585.1 amidoligase family protein [Clostridium pasteurianum]